MYYGIWAVRGSGSILGAFEAWNKHDGIPIVYAGNDIAARQAAKYNENNASPNVHYYVKEMEPEVALQAIQAREQAFMEKQEVYLYPAAYARERYELPQYRASNRLNSECAKAIEEAVRENWDGSRINQTGAQGVIGIYGEKRVNLVLANTVNRMNYDTRFSRDNRAWADAFPRIQQSIECSINAHSVKLDSFIDVARNKGLERNDPNKKEPVYPHSLEYAHEHGEADVFYKSKEANRACIKSIAEAVHNSYKGEYRYDLKAAAKTVIDEHGFVRLNHVLANILLNHHYDGRYSPENKEWARDFGLVHDRDIYCDTHPAILDGFINIVRKNQREIFVEAIGQYEKSRHMAERNRLTWYNSDTGEYRVNPGVTDMRLMARHNEIMAMKQVRENKRRRPTDGLPSQKNNTPKRRESLSATLEAAKKTAKESTPSETKPHKRAPTGHEIG